MENIFQNASKEYSWDDQSNIASNSLNPLSLCFVVCVGMCFNVKKNLLIVRVILIPFGITPTVLFILHIIYANANGSQ